MKSIFIANLQTSFTHDYQASYGINMIGRVEKYLMKRIKMEGTIHMTLVDPEKVNIVTASKIAKNAESCNTAAIKVGGSTSDLNNPS